MILLSYLYEYIFIINIISYETIVGISFILLFIGIPYLFISGKKITKDFKNNELITDGIFAYVRNPIYSAWILFIIPALTILTKSIALMTTPIFTYILFKILIKKEDEFLEKKFGTKYLSYKNRVNELIPWLPKTCYKNL